MTPCSTTPHDFPAFGPPFFARYTLFDACAPAMAAFSPPLTLSECVPKIISAGDRPAQHAQPGLPGPAPMEHGACSRCVVDDDAKIYVGSDERSALHHFLVQAQWLGSGNSLREALARGDFRMTRETCSAVWPPGESATPLAKRARLL